MYQQQLFANNIFQLLKLRQLLGVLQFFLQGKHRRNYIIIMADEIITLDDDAVEEPVKMNGGQSAVWTYLTITNDKRY